MGEDLWRRSATDIADLVRRRVVAPTEVVAAFLARIEDVDPALHAFCLVDADGAREAARSLDARVAAGHDPGPLAGVPVAVKDLISTAGLRTTGGCAAYADLVPDEDDVSVERVRRAGGVVIGKTNVSELGYGGVGQNPLFATTRNPWDPSRTSGGSSAGSAVAVATGMSPLALGSDGGGSIRIPASFCGIVGAKASMGRVPLYPGCRDPGLPGLSSWETIEHIGPLARSVADAALLLSVVAGPDRRDRHSIPTGDVDWLGCLEGLPSGLRIGVSEDWGYAAVESGVRARLQAAAVVFQDVLGCEVGEFVAPWTNPNEWFASVVALDSDLTAMRRMPRPRVPGTSPGLSAILDRHWRAEDFTDAGMRRKELYNYLWRLLDHYDLILTPTTAVTAFAADGFGVPTIEGRKASADDWSPFAAIANLAGLPAISVPCGMDDSGLPVGVQLMGGHLQDGLVLAAAAAFERASGQPDGAEARFAAIERRYTRPGH